MKGVLKDGRPGSERLMTATALRAGVARIFHAAGLSRADSALVAADLVEGDLCGLTSHGVFRVAQYVEALRECGLNPRARIRTVRQTASTGVYDCGWNLGIVSAHRMVDRLLTKVKVNGLAAVVGTECYHIGRLANYKKATYVALRIPLANSAYPHLFEFYPKRSCPGKFMLGLSVTGS